MVNIVNVSLGTNGWTCDQFFEIHRAKYLDRFEKSLTLGRLEAKPKTW